MQRALLLACIALTGLAGCGDGAKGLAKGIAQLEAFNCEYLWGQQDAQNAFQLTHPADPNTNTFTQLIHGRSLDHVALTVQTQGDAEQPLETGGSEYRLPHDEIQRLRGVGLDAKLQLTGRNGVQIEMDRTSSNVDTFPDPTSILIQVSEAQTVGQKTSEGSITIFFGARGPTFKAESAAGKIPWTVNSPERNTFLEFALTFLDQAAAKAAGEFQCIARNANDSNDKRLLIIMHGNFALKIE
jgi:hypothetical protein